MFKISLFCGCFLYCMLVLVPAEGQQSPADQAQALLKEGKADRALPILLQLHRDEPSNPNVCQQIGVIYTQLNDLTHAEGFYREAVRLDPEFYAARKNLGTVLWFLNRKAESEQEFLIVTKARPADAVPHLYLALAARNAANSRRPNSNSFAPERSLPKIRKWCNLFWNPIWLLTI